MIIRPLKTSILFPPQDDLLSAVKKALPRLKEKSILAVTSKAISIWEGRCIKKNKFSDKDELIKKEADFYLPRSSVPGKWIMHTLKNNLFMPMAGVDESNAGGFYVLWPKNPKQSARNLYNWARRIYEVKNLGIIITDSHTIPLRRGMIGISLAHYGFLPLRDYRGTKDLFGRRLEMTQTNIVDALAAAAVVVMGEGAESTPLALISDLPWVKFRTRPAISKRPFSTLEIKTKEDLYYPLFSSVPWKKGQGGIK